MRECIVCGHVVRPERGGRAITCSQRCSAQRHADRKIQLRADGYRAPSEEWNDDARARAKKRRALAAVGRLRLDGDIILIDRVRIALPELIDFLKKSGKL
jgi:hypothetical protein